VYVNPTLSKKKIVLVVDDDVVVLKTLSNKLNAKGYDVRTETDIVGVLARLRGGSPDAEVLESVQGAEGSASAREEQRIKPDLILLDIGFPPGIDSVPWDGFLIMEWLKRMDGASAIPVIIISGSDPAQYEAKARAAGAIAFFRKPVSHEELLAVIRKTLGEETGSNPATLKRDGEPAVELADREK
jgi:CheY-like chemotaxis protein